jgi:hypothetical protein
MSTSWSFSGVTPIPACDPVEQWTPVDPSSTVLSKLLATPDGGTFAKSSKYFS